MTEKVLITIVFETRTNGQDPEIIVEDLARELEDVGIDNYDTFTIEDWKMEE